MKKEEKNNNFFIKNRCNKKQCYVGNNSVTPKGIIVKLKSFYTPQQQIQINKQTNTQILNYTITLTNTCTYLHMYIRTLTSSFINENQSIRRLYAINNIFVTKNRKKKYALKIPQTNETINACFRFLYTFSNTHKYLLLHTYIYIDI